MKKLRINIASSHRFHLLDLARELSQHGLSLSVYNENGALVCDNGISPGEVTSNPSTVAPGEMTSVPGEAPGEMTSVPGEMI